LSDKNLFVLLVTHVTQKSHAEFSSASQNSYKLRFRSRWVGTEWQNEWF